MEAEFGLPSGAESLLEHIPRVMEALLGLCRNFDQHDEATELNKAWINGYVAMFPNSLAETSMPPPPQTEPTQSSKSTCDGESCVDRGGEVHEGMSFAQILK